MENIHKIILEDALAGYWDWNIPEKTEYLSPTFKAMFGYEDHELPNTPDSWQKLIFKDDLDVVLENFDAHVKSKGEVPYHNHVRYRHKDGSTVWVVCTGRVIEWDKDDNPIRMIGCHVEITKEKIYEEQLKTSEQRFKGAFEFSPIGMALIAKDGSFMQVNRRLCKILQYTEEELSRMKFADVTHPDDLGPDLASYDKMIRGEISSFGLEKRYLRKDGGIVWVYLRVSTVMDTFENPLHFVTQIEDISERKLAQKKLEDAFEIVQQQNKRLLDFAHIVSHNLRSHTGNLHMMLQFFEDEKDPDEKKMLWEQIRQISNAFQDTIAHLREVVQIQTEAEIGTEEIQLIDYVSKAIQSIGADIKKNSVNIKNRINHNLRVHCNPAYMDSIILNMLTNAIRYRHPDRQPEIEIDSGEENGYTVLSFSDNGLGIDLERHGHKIFGLYKTFHRHPEARGVGLFITKNQIESMGGKLKVESVPEEGSTFKIYLRK